MAREAVVRTPNHQQDDNAQDSDNSDLNGDIPVLKAVVQSGDRELIKSARQSTGQHAVFTDISADKNDESAAFESVGDLSDIDNTSGMVCESDLEQTIEAIITQHVNSMRAEIKAVLWLHTQTQANDESDASTPS